MIRAGDFQVHGDLDELLPDVGRRRRCRTPTSPPMTEMLDGLPDVIAEMLLRTGALSADLGGGAAAATTALTESCQQLETRVAQLTTELEERTGRRHRWLPYRDRARPGRRRAPTPARRQTLTGSGGTRGRVGRKRAQMDVTSGGGQSRGPLPAGRLLDDPTKGVSAWAGCARPRASPRTSRRS